MQVKIDKNMRTFEDSYELFGRLVADENIFLDPAFSFERTCRMVGVGRAEMDEVLQRELGLGGDELFGALRAGFRDRLRIKYALKCFFGEV